VDTSLPSGFIFPPKPLKFQIYALTSQGKVRMKSFFRDASDSQDSTLSSLNDLLFIATLDTTTNTYVQTWNVKMDTSAVAGHAVYPKPGDVYVLHLVLPFQDGDAFSFHTTGQKVDLARAQADGEYNPYVVPNPYVGAASFEPQRFAISGRGERRMEFRGLPSTCTVRIYTIKGELVQTLSQSNSLVGYLAWDLRTKDNLDVAPGLYIYHVDAGPLGTKMGKFAIIK
ncbi:MAG TPA: hypothetical protein VI758_06285, partial [Bacteroidota bacterium]